MVSDQQIRSVCTITLMCLKMLRQNITANTYELNVQGNVFLIYLHRANQTTDSKNVCAFLFCRWTVKNSLCVHKQYGDLKNKT